MNTDALKLLKRIADAEDAGAPLVADDLTVKQVWDFNVSLANNLADIDQSGKVDVLVVTDIGRRALAEQEQQP